MLAGSIAQESLSNTSTSFSGLTSSIQECSFPEFMKRANGFMKTQEHNALQSCMRQTLHAGGRCQAAPEVAKRVVIWQTMHAGGRCQAAPENVERVVAAGLLAIALNVAGPAHAEFRLPPVDKGDAFVLKLILFFRILVKPPQQSHTGRVTIDLDRLILYASDLKHKHAVIHSWTLRPRSSR
jgi:hypothetical protein